MGQKYSMMILGLVGSFIWYLIDIRLKDCERLAEFYDKSLVVFYKDFVKREIAELK